MSIPKLRSGRILGIDVARSIAMFGMVIAHYVWADGSGTLLDMVASATRGRAMPLFVMLGGVGVAILTSRSTAPDRALLIRAAILFPFGVVLQEATTFIAIILQAYALFFVAAVLLRRLPTSALIGTAVAVALAGSWTSQIFVPNPVSWPGPTELLSVPDVVAWSLLFDGFYPFFPVGAFFIFGMILGRVDLGSTEVAKHLAIWGSVVGFGTLFVASAAIDVFNVDRGLFDATATEFQLTRLLNTEGHADMLAWVVSATGTSAAVLGVSLLITPVLGRVASPSVALGRLALTFYVVQAVLVRVTPHPRETGLGQEFTTAMIIYFGFMAFAFVWTQSYRSGPFEALLRLGSPPSTRSKPTSIPSGAG